MSKFALGRVCPFLALLLSCAIGAATAQAESAEGPALPAAAEGEGHAEHEHGGHGNHPPGHANANSDIDSPAEWSTQLAVYTFIVFWLVLAILGKAAWPKISAALVEREQHIEGQIAAAEAMHEEAKKILAEHEAKIATTAEEVRGMLEEARRDAESTKDQIVAEAREAAQLEQDRAVREVEVAKDQALKSMAEHSANLAIDLAGKVIRESISADKQAELVRESLAQLASHPSNN